ncbi:MAG: hypothetical protein K0S37_3321 [Microbacterium sp.]|nr:hypothetical protein [Microbacterium sp.]
MGLYRSTSSTVPVTGSHRMRSHPGTCAARCRAVSGSMGLRPDTEAPASVRPIRVRTGTVTCTCARIAPSPPGQVASVVGSTVGAPVSRRSAHTSAPICASVRSSRNATASSLDVSRPGAAEVSTGSARELSVEALAVGCAALTARIAAACRRSRSRMPYATVAGRITLSSAIPSARSRTLTPRVCAARAWRAVMPSG